MASSSSSSSSPSSLILPTVVFDKELGKLLREWLVKPTTPTSTSTGRTTPIPTDVYERLKKVVDELHMLSDANKEESVAHLRRVMESLIKRVMVDDPNNSANYQQLLLKVNPPPRRRLVLPHQLLVQQREVDFGGDLCILDYEVRYARKLDSKERACLRLFSVLPERFVVNKREVFYLGLGLSIDDHYSENDLKDDSTLAKLVAEGFLTIFNTSTSNRFSSAYMMQSSVLSWARQKNGTSMSTIGAEHASLLAASMHGNKTAVININIKVLKTPILEKVGDYKPAVLHLGTWRHRPNNYSRDEDYIVVDQESLHKTFLNLNSSVWWLSLRGTSGIVHLPDSISNHIHMRFLDLSACNNLVSLPKEIGSLKSLEYLDLSECYLLEYIPKDITSLPSLKVLKGFIINSNRHVRPRSSRRKWRNKLTAPTSSSSSCPFSELRHLICLEKLTIRTTSMNFPTNEDLRTLCSLQHLRILGITWVANPERAQFDGNLQEFPNTIEKLVLQNASLQRTSQLLELIGKQEQRSHMNKLYIRGGWFREFSPEKHCFPTIKIVRLRYLRKLKVEWEQFRRFFPNLTCLEVFKCPMLTSFPCGISRIWQK